MLRDACPMRSEREFISRSIIAFALLLWAIDAVCGAAAGSKVSCSDEWYRFVEQKTSTGDGQGHGPDPGSDEWKGAVEFRLGIRERPDKPPRDSKAWCDYIDRLLRPG